MSSQKPKAVLVVDDDAEVRLSLRDFLTESGYSVYEAAGREDAMAAIANHRIDLMTLDLGLGHEDGLAIAQDIRKMSLVPIIIVSARAQEIDRIIGLEVGADDYVVKPFNLREVLARIRAVLRRRDYSGPSSGEHSASQLTFSGWTINAISRELRNPQGEPIALTSTEFDLLQVLARHTGQVLSREKLIDLLKGPDANPFDRSIDTIVSRVRKKIEVNPDAPEIIKTVRGSGYQFAVPASPV